MHTSEQNNHQTETGKLFPVSVDKKRRKVLKNRRAAYEQIEHGELEMWGGKK